MLRGVERSVILGTKSGDREDSSMIDRILCKGCLH